MWLAGWKVVQEQVEFDGKKEDRGCQVSVKLEVSVRRRFPCSQFLESLTPFSAFSLSFFHYMGNQLHLMFETRLKLTCGVNE